MELGNGHLGFLIFPRFLPDAAPNTALTYIGKQLFPTYWERRRGSKHPSLAKGFRIGEHVVVNKSTQYLGRKCTYIQ